jgi:multidrug efflux pump subunit AcrA (membrane-fusion protein)
MRLLVASVILAAMAALWAIGPLNAAQKTTEASPPLARAVPVLTQPAVNASGYATRRQFSGVLQAKRQSELSFLRSGMLSQVLVQEGDVVTAGQVVAELDTRELDARQARLAAELAGAEARLAEALAGPRREPRRGAQAEVRRLTSELELARLKQGRRRQLFEAGAVPQESLDELDTQVRSLEQSLEAARQDSLELENGTRPEVVDQARAQLQAAQAELNALQVDFQDSVLRAPFQGRVLARNLDEGTVVQPGRPVFVLAETSTLEARIALPQGQPIPNRPRLTIGGRAEVGRLLGKVPQVEKATNTAVVRYAVTAGLPGEPVLLDLEEKIAEPGFWVPTACLSSAGDGLWQCYTVSPDQTVQVQRLELLHRETDRVLVRGTLRPGDQVIVEGIGQVVPGQKVQARTAGV